MKTYLLNCSLRGILLLVGILGSTVNGAQAETITVTNNSDNVSFPVLGSLRAAIIAAADGDTIDFDPAVTGTIVLGGFELAINKDLVISGPGAANLSVSGNTTSRVLNIPTGKIVSISGLTIKNGRAPIGPPNPGDGIPAGDGGGILNYGSLSLTNCVITSNQTAGGGSAGSNGGGIANFGTLALHSSKISANSTLPSHGGRDGSGGGIFNSGTFTAVDCAISGNATGDIVSESFSAIPQGSGGGVCSTTPFTLTNCTISSNRTGSFTGSFPGGNSVPGSGGGVYGSATCVNCTFTDNRTGFGGVSNNQGRPAGRGGALFGNVNLTSCTIVGNQTNTSGVYSSMSQGGGVSGSGTLRNCVVAGNIAYDGRTRLGGGAFTLVPATGFDLDGTFTTAGFNLIGKVDGSTGVVNGVTNDLAGSIATPLNPIVSTVGSNGGPTQTFLLLPGSPALDSGDDSLSGTDQRGSPRLLGAHVDRGAVETDITGLAVVTFSTSGVTVDESSGTVNIVVTRTGDLSGSATVAFASSSFTATSGSDFTAATGTLSFGPLESEKVIPIQILDDLAVETNEMFRVSLSAPTGAYVGANAVITVTIGGNDDGGEVGFSAASSTVSETDGNAFVSIVRSRTSGSVTVSYATSSGSAAAGSDFTTTTGTVTFAEGVGEQTIAIPILNDSIFEGSETFTIQLSNPSVNALLGGQTVHTVSITSDDPAPPSPTIAFRIASSAVEENSGFAVLAVRRTASLSEVCSVSYSTASGTALSGSDFTSSSGTVNFASGDVEKFMVVPITADSESEGDESFTVTLSNPLGGGAVLGAQAMHTVTILGGSTVAFAAGGASVSEAAGSVSVNVARSGSLAGAATVQYSTVAETASAGSDFGATSGTLNFPAGVSQLTVTVPIFMDSTLDDGETFSIVLASPSGAVIGALGSAQITVTDVAPPRNGGFRGLARLRDGKGLGGIVLTTTVLNRLSGSLKLGGRTYTFTGPMSSTGSYAKVFSLMVNAQTVQRTLALQQSADGHEITGTFTMENSAVYDIVAEADAVGQTMAGAGNYNAVLGSETPLLRGTARTTFKPNGTISMRGYLPDGSAFAASSRIGASGNVAIFLPLYTRASGYVGGTTSIAAGEISGAFEWEKPPKLLSVFPDGFDDQGLSLNGALYTFTPGQRALNDFNATNGIGSALFIGGGLSSDLEIPLNYSTRNVFTLSSKNAAISLAARTGLFQGSFKDAGGIRCAVKGIIIPRPGSDNDMAQGFFINGASSGFVEIVTK